MASGKPSPNQSRQLDVHRHPDLWLPRVYWFPGLLITARVCRAASLDSPLHPLQSGCHLLSRSPESYKARKGRGLLTLDVCRVAVSTWPCSHLGLPDACSIWSLSPARAGLSWLAVNRLVGFSLLPFPPVLLLLCFFLSSQNSLSLLPWLLAFRVVGL